MDVQRKLKFSLENVLKASLENRKLKNTNYSLRAMARDIGISPSTLSKIMNGKCSPSDKMLMDILIRLGLPTEVKERVLFFERCRKLLEFLNSRSSGQSIVAISEVDKNECHFQKSIILDKNIYPDVLFYLKTMNEGFFTAVESLSVSKDSFLYLDNTFDVRETL